MEKAYWLSRKRASLKLARDAASAEARLIHYDLAGRYGLKALSLQSFAVELADSCHRRSTRAGAPLRPADNPGRGHLLGVSPNPAHANQHAVRSREFDAARQLEACPEQELRHRVY